MDAAYPTIKITCGLYSFEREYTNEMFNRECKIDEHVTHVSPVLKDSMGPYDILQECARFKLPIF